MSRGLLYFSLGVLTVLGPAFVEFDAKPPTKWVIAALVCGALASGLNSIRAYMDQHLSRQKTEDKQNETEANNP